MPELHNNLSNAVVTLPRGAFRRMIRLVRLLDRLSRQAAYRELVYPQVPEVARLDPGHDAVMMCYDFHLADDGPRLIEVNTNAGGGLLAWLAHQPSLPVTPQALAPDLKQRLLQTFADEIRQFSTGVRSKPTRIVIVDETPEQQFLYPEMQAFAELFRAWGVPADIVEPHQLQASAEGVISAGERVDLVYNRHCDFYLESPAMAGLCAAYLAHSVCLSPNPHVYGLLADKRRMTLWSDPDVRDALGLSCSDQRLLDATVPLSRLFSASEPARLWAERKRWVFKPVDSFGSRGVLLGEKISRKRFDELPGEATLVQKLIPPSMTTLASGEQMKTDFRLYAYRNRVLGITARLYRGQVTNLRTPGGGFAPVRVTSLKS